MLKQIDVVKKQWNEEKDLNRWDRFYYQNDHHGSKLRSREKKILEFLDNLHLKKGVHILELGYGAGRTSAKILGRGFNITGVDISKQLCKLAIKNCSKVNTKAKFKMTVGNVEELIFPDNYFDCVVGLGFLQYLDYPNKCLKEVHRVLKPNGYFIIAQTNIYGVSKIDSFLKLVRAVIYLITQKRYEIRYTDKPFIWFVLGFATLTSGMFSSMKKLRIYLITQSKVGFVKRNALSLLRLKKMIEKAHLKVIRRAGAGYLTKKSKYFPEIAKKLDKYLQGISDRKKKTLIHHFGNGVVLVAKKKN